MNIVELLDRHAAERPDAVALIETVRGRDRLTTFRRLHQQSCGIADALQQCGVHVDDHVLLLTPVSQALYAALLGILRMGAVAMVVDPSAGIGGLRRCSRRIGPRAVMTAGCMPRLLARVLPELRRAARIDVQRVVELSQAEPIARSPDAPALLTFTSGSTDEPKAVVRSHGLLLAQHDALSSVIQQQPGDVCLATLPIFVLSHLAAGATTVLAEANLARPAAIDPRPVLAQIQRHPPTCTVASPALLLRLSDEVRRSGLSDPGFRTVYTGGAPVFPDMVQRLECLAPAGQISLLYGSTEAEPIAHLDALTEAHATRIASGAGLPAGRPVDAVQVRIIRRCARPRPSLTSEELRAMTLEANQPGEIVVAGAHVVPGYLDGRGDETCKIRVGDTVWHRTGDAGRIDDDGDLWLLGRCEAVIERERGPDLHPFAVEAAARVATGLRTALIEHECKPTLLVESAGGRFTTQQRQRIKDALAWAGAIRLQPVRRIPLDRRHNAKIDYTRLKRMLR
jgi:acyl-CoA synthetase (AMP-forming)/AMP-acid ligase II